MDDDRTWIGKSKVSFAEAAQDAVRHAEEDLDEPTEFDVSLRCKNEAGNSLSEYIAILSIH